MASDEREERDERRLAWDERHSHGDFEGDGPNETLVRATFGLPRGRALELACGSGTNAIWLATQGFDVTAVDWSAVGLENGAAKAKAAGVSVDWQRHDLFAWKPPERAFDLVAIVYLHLPNEERLPVYDAAAAAVAPGGRMLVVAHHPQNAVEGFGGPPPERMLTPEQIAEALRAGDPTLEVERAEVLRRSDLERPPIDTLAIVRRPESSADAAAQPDRSSHA